MIRRRRSAGPAARLDEGEAVAAAGVRVAKAAAVFVAHLLAARNEVRDLFGEGGPLRCVRLLELGIGTDSGEGVGVMGAVLVWVRIVGAVVVVAIQMLFLLVVDQRTVRPAVCRACFVIGSLLLVPVRVVAVDDVRGDIVVQHPREQLDPDGAGDEAGNEGPRRRLRTKPSFLQRRLGRRQHAVERGEELEGRRRDRHCKHKQSRDGYAG